MNTDNDTLHAPTPSSMMPPGRHDSELFRVYALILDGITDHVLLPGKKLTESDGLLAQYRARRAVPVGTRQNR